MSVTRDSTTGKWEVSTRYKDWSGETRRKHKRGFATKREAQEWERSFLNCNSGNLNMAFGDFYRVYQEEVEPILRLTTRRTKRGRAKKWILPFFEGAKMNEIEPRDIVRWENMLMGPHGPDGNRLAETTLRTIYSDLNAIFNYAVRMYGLASNPCKKAGSIGKQEANEMKFWDPEQYAAFAAKAAVEPRVYCAFETLYWNGLRVGEMLALLHEDPQYARRIIPITKSLQVIHGEKVVTGPKTPDGFRNVVMPASYQYELMRYASSCYGARPTDRLFSMSRSFLRNRLRKYAEEAGLEPIRVHDLRHSHASLLLELGFTAVDIGKRLGQSDLGTTLRYAHMFPNKQDEMAAKLDYVKRREDEAYGICQGDGCDFWVYSEYGPELGPTAGACGDAARAIRYGDGPVSCAEEPCGVAGRDPGAARSLSPSSFCGRGAGEDSSAASDDDIAEKLDGVMRMVKCRA